MCYIIIISVGTYIIYKTAIHFCYLLSYNRFFYSAYLYILYSFNGIRNRLLYQSNLNDYNLLVINTLYIYIH